MSGGSGRGKGVKKGNANPWEGDPNAWEGGLGPEDFSESVERFPEQCKREFTREHPLKNYDKRREDWPKCMHGEDCLVQMMTEGPDGGRRFFKCPRAIVNAITNPFFNIFSLRLPLTRSTYYRVPLPPKTAGLSGGSILVHFGHISSTSTTCRTGSSI
jgi:hypothetical protein